MASRRQPTYDELVKLVESLTKRVAELERELAKSKRNSSNSSKPPSSDIVKPKKDKPKGRRKRRIGAQPGHEKREREFSPDDADEQHGHDLDSCPKCSCADLLLLPDATKIFYQYELVEKPVHLNAHVFFGYWCPECAEVHHDAVPSDLRSGGLVGPRLTALIGYLKGGCHASYSTIQSLLGDALGVRLSSGMIAKTVQKVSRALEAPYMELLQRLPSEGHLNIDETGHKENGRQLWNWVFRAKDFTVFTIAESRGAKVLEEMLGTECGAVLGHDHYSSYRAYMKSAPVTVQFCLAHLIREVKFLAESNSATIANYGKRVLGGLKRIFKLIHRRGEIPPDSFRKRLERERDRFLAMAKRTKAGGEAATLAERLRKYGKQYFTFITEPEIDPTNNVAEQAIRFCVIDRRVTQGTRGNNGRRWSERIWTAMATCSQQGRSSFEFLSGAVHAFFLKQPSPSLAPSR
jgi:transposase